MQFELNCEITMLKVMIKEDCDNGLCAWETYRSPLPSNVFKMDLCACLTVRGACYWVYLTVIKCFVFRWSLGTQK